MAFLLRNIVVLAFCLTSGLLHAQTTNCTAISSAPYIISAPGFYCLTADLTTNNPSSGFYAISIQADNVVLDLNGHRIGGVAAGAGTQAIGITAVDKRYITIRNGSIRGYRVGISAGDSNQFGATTAQGWLIENLRLDQNTYIGIFLAAKNSIARNNRIIATGNGSTPSSTEAVGIYAAGHNIRILENDITQLSASFGGVIGIWMNYANGAFVSGNRISDLSSPSWATAIEVYAADQGIIRHNSMLLASAPSSTGLALSGTTNFVYLDNIAQGFGTAYSGGTDLGNNH